MVSQENEKKGLFTVIMPTYNRAHFILDAISSVFRQTYRPIQLVIVDDGSSDDTEKLIDDWRREHKDDQDFRLDLVKQEQKGACVARNSGILHSEGEFLVFMDSDDVLFPHAFEWAAQSLADPELEYVYFRVHRSDQNLVPFPNEYVGHAPSQTNADICLYLWHTMGAVYRRSIVDKVGFWNPELTGSQDWEFAARIKMPGAKFAYDRRVVGLFRDHPYGRIGVRRFKHDYVRSVELACDSIQEHAEKAGVLDVTVRRQLARRLFVHAIEFGAHGYFDDKDRLLKKARTLLADDVGKFQFPIRFFQTLNSRSLSRGSLLLHKLRSATRSTPKVERATFPAIRPLAATEIIAARRSA